MLVGRCDGDSEGDGVGTVLGVAEGLEDGCRVGPLDGILERVGADDGLSEHIEDPSLVVPAATAVKQLG